MTTERLLLWELILYVDVQCISVVRLLLLSVHDHYVAKNLYI